MKNMRLSIVLDGSSIAAYSVHARKQDIAGGLYGVLR